MPLPAGTMIGQYESLSLIGSGGMGEVYRALDTKLKRDVALKVLPAAFTADTERVSRFKREAQVLASLNHPHIAIIYGLEESDGARALIMELVEGEDLVTNDGKLHVRTVAGPKRADVVWRRVDADWLDPLDVRNGWHDRRSLRRIKARLVGI
mgnify:CR=1 FL=1